MSEQPSLTFKPSSPAASGQPRVVSGLRSRQPAAAQALPVLQLDERTYARALDCVHCGLCLPACPTYTQNGLEGDSPRGRIVLMKELADGKILASEPVLRHLDLCLDCRACETACPSGVRYHELIEETRARLEPRRERSAVDRLVRTLFLRVFSRPGRLRLALLPARLLQKIGLWKLLSRPSLTRLLPRQLEKMQQMLPPDGPLWEKPLLQRYPATANRRADGRPRATVGFFAGCVGSVLFQDVNRQTIELLQHCGCDVLVPPAQACCGAMHHHAGEIEPAEDLARTNIEAFFPQGATEPAVDYVVNNIAGCGAMLKDYDHLLRDDPAYAERARAFVARVRDISELLVELDPPRPPHRVERTVTYHHACHLAHAQKVTEPPLTLLSWIDGLKIIPLREADMCCGAAGTYNLTEPAMAHDLGQRKVRHIDQTGAGTCVTGNVGCAMQIQSEARQAGAAFTTAHPVTLLHQAYFGPDRTSSPQSGA